MSDPRGGRGVIPFAPPLLLILGGLPGTGKTTLARQAATILGAAYLRIDTIEETIAEAGMEAGPLGYAIAQALALDNLRGCGRVVADGVNAVEIARKAWRDVAELSGTGALEVEIVCSDRAEHRRRIEARLIERPGGPEWADVEMRNVEPWVQAGRIDTAGRTPETCLADLLQFVSAV